MHGKVEAVRVVRVQRLKELMGLTGPHITAPDEYLTLSVQYHRSPETHSFEVLLGPDSGGSVDPNTATLILTKGWAYAAGQWPRIANGNVMAGADGSAIAMQIVAGGTRRIFFLHGREATVEALGDRRTWTDWGKYVDVDSSDVIVPAPLDLNADVTILEKYKNIHELGYAALEAEAN